MTDQPIRSAPVVERFARDVRRGIGLAELANGRLHRWPGVRIPLGSRIGGASRITIEPGFRPLGAVWIEAVERYEDETYSPSIVIGRDFRCSPGLHITATNAIRIGENVLAGSNVFIGDHGHGGYRGDTPDDLDLPPYRRPLRSSGIVEVGANVWLGNNVVVLGPVRIGHGCVIGANSVVTRDLPDHSLAVGAPAAAVRTLR